MFSSEDAEAMYDMALEFAEQAEQDGSELKYRAAINRVYYGVFLFGREQTRTTTDVDVHAEVIRRTRRMRGEIVSQELSDLRTLRQLADYDFSATSAELEVWRTRWEEARKLARRLLDRLAETRGRR